MLLIPDPYPDQTVLNEYYPTYTVLWSFRSLLNLVHFRGDTYSAIVSQILVVKYNRFQGRLDTLPRYQVDATASFLAPKGF